MRRFQFHHDLRELVARPEAISRPGASTTSSTPHSPLKYLVMPYTTLGGALLIARGVERGLAPEAPTALRRILTALLYASLIETRSSTAYVRLPRILSV